MNNSNDEDLDLPNVDVGVHFNIDNNGVTNIDVDYEISKDLQRKELRKKILEEKVQYEEETIEIPKIAPTPKSKICSLPPRRQFLHPERSLKCFNSNSLTTQNFSHSNYTSCTSENAHDFFSWVRSQLKSSDNVLRRQFLQYLWLLMSCHPDQLVVQKCCDVLMEHNSSWQLQYEEVITIFYNWGASPEDFVSDVPLRNIKAPLVISSLVSPVNVENALHVLSRQLMKGDLEGSQCCSKSVFILLTLLTLDDEYLCCLSDAHACLEQLSSYANLQNSHWVEEYSEDLLLVEWHHSRIAFLLECVVPECMRWCLCLAHCQQVFSLKQTFQADPEPDQLQTILHDHFDTFINLGSWELHSLLLIVDAGINHVISHETDKEIKRGFIDWLNEFMDRKIERRTPDIDIDATLIAQLVSRLQVEWESAWLEVPTVAADEAEVITFDEEQ